MYLQSTDWPCASHWQGACKKTQLKLVPPMTITFLEFAAAAVTFILFCERENWQRCLGLPSLHSCLSFIERKQQNNSKSPNICYCGVVHEIISHPTVTRERYIQYLVSLSRRNSKVSETIQTERFLKVEQEIMDKEAWSLLSRLKLIEYLPLEVEGRSEI